MYLPCLNSNISNMQNMQVNTMQHTHTADYQTMLEFPEEMPDGLIIYPEIGYWPTEPQQHVFDSSFDEEPDDYCPQTYFLPAQILHFACAVGCVE
jgi:hypothetical protein